MSWSDPPIGLGARLMLPEQLAFKRKAEKNTERIKAEKRAIQRDPKVNSAGLAAARKALVRKSK